MEEEGGESKRVGGTNVGGRGKGVDRVGQKWNGFLCR